MTRNRAEAVQLRHSYTAQDIRSCRSVTFVRMPIRPCCRDFEEGTRGRVELASHQQVQRMMLD